MLMAIVGEFNVNLSELEKITNTKLFLEEIQLPSKEIKTQF